jgi:integrase
MYAQTGLRIKVKRARVPKPGEPDALTKTEQGRVERATTRRGVRDRAIIAVLLYAGARVEECGRLDAEDVTLTARTGHVRLHGKGDEVRTVPLPPVARGQLAAWLDERGTHDGPLWTGQRGRAGVSVNGGARDRTCAPHCIRHASPKCPSLPRNSTFSKSDPPATQGHPQPWTRLLHPAHWCIRADCWDRGWSSSASSAEMWWRPAVSPETSARRQVHARRR